MTTEINQEVVAAAIQQALKRVQESMPPAINPMVGQAPATGFMPPAMQQQQQPVGLNPTGWSLPIEMDINGFSFTVYLQFPPQMFPQCAQVVQALVSMGYHVRGGSRGGFNNNGFGNGGGGYFHRNSYGRRY